MSGDDIPMDVFSSSASEGSVTCSTGPTTPSASPLFRPSEYDDLKLAALPQSRVLSETELPRIAVKNVCVIGAGYVGRSHVTDHPGMKVLAELTLTISLQVVPRLQFWPSITRPSRSKCWTETQAGFNDGSPSICPFTSRAWIPWCASYATVPRSATK